MRTHHSAALAALFMAGVILSPGTVLTAETLLTGSEITGLLTGKTFTGTAGQIHFKKTYGADGTYSLVIEDKQARQGTWKVEGNSYCQTRRDEEECFTVRKDGATYKMYSGDQLHTSFQPE